MQEAFAAHLRHVARIYPAERHKRVVLVIDNAPGIGAVRSRTRWRTTRTWSSSGCPATARS